MIVKGKSRRDAAQLADYLLDLQKNEHALVLEQAVYHDDPATALHNSLTHFEHMARLTDGSLGLYHAQVSPEDHEDNRLLTHADWIRAVDILEKKLGYQGQPRVIVLHEKDGQTHAHVVWQRAHEEKQILLPDGWNYPKHEIAARQMEREFGHKLVKGVFTGREWGEERPIAKTNHAEWQQGERTGVKPEARKAEIAALWQLSDSGQAFVSALHQAGYELARGDKKDLHMLVKDGELYDLRRSLKSVLKDIKKKDIETRLADYPAHQLPLAGEVKARQLATARQEALARESVEPMQQAEALQASAEDEARDELAWEREQAAAMEAARDRHEAKLREARLLWQEIVEPRQRREDLQATVDRAGQEERSHRQAQVIDFETARDRYEAKLREAKRQAQELVEVRQAQAAVIAISDGAANDNRDGPPAERGAVPDPTLRQLKSFSAKGRSLSLHSPRKKLRPDLRVPRPLPPSTAPWSGRAKPCGESSSRRGSVWSGSRPSDEGGSREAVSGSGWGFLRLSAGCLVSRRPRDGPEGSSSPTSASAGSGSDWTPTSSARRPNWKSVMSNYVSSSGSWRREGGWWTVLGNPLRGKLAVLWRMSHSPHEGTAEAMAEDAAAPLPPPCRISRAAPEPGF